MQWRIRSRLSYQVLEDASFFLNVQPLQHSSQRILMETFSTNPILLVNSLQSRAGEKRFLHFETKGPFEIEFQYEAHVETRYSIVRMDQDQKEFGLGPIDPSVLYYLNPSRYCPSDRLINFAREKFGGFRSILEQVDAITNWIHDHINYLVGTTNTATTALDTFLDGAGVCRDFAHLGITFCRSLAIPARYCSAYAYELNPPDFHACFEAYIGGNWCLFDATGLAPLNGLTIIGYGLDAADCSIANIFGNAMGMMVSVEVGKLEGDFSPLYLTGDSEAISYAEPIIQE